MNDEKYDNGCDAGRRIWSFNDAVEYYSSDSESLEWSLPTLFEREENSEDDDSDNGHYGLRPIWALMIDSGYWQHSVIDNNTEPITIFIVKDVLKM